MSEQQREFDGMPERTVLGKKAIEYLNKKDEVENRKKELDKIKLALGMLFAGEGKMSIKIENRLVTYSVAEKEKITVKNVTS